MEDEQNKKKDTLAKRAAMKKKRKAQQRTAEKDRAKKDTARLSCGSRQPSHHVEKKITRTPGNTTASTEGNEASNAELIALMIVPP